MKTKSSKWIVLTILVVVAVLTLLAGITFLNSYDIHTANNDCNFENGYTFTAESFGK